MGTERRGERGRNLVVGREEDQTEMGGELLQKFDGCVADMSLYKYNNK